MKTVKDKISVITGAGMGIGRAIALALAEGGCHVVVSDIQEAAAQDVAKEVRAHGVRAIAVACDVSDGAAVGVLAETAYGEFGVVDILCNNAGVSWRPWRSALETTLEDWRFMLGVNLWGVLNGLDAFLPRMRRQAGEKHIVNTASLATPTSARLATFGLDSAEPVGVMVRNAILVNALCLHTALVPMDLVAERVHTLFGPSTVGHV